VPVTILGQGELKKKLTVKRTRLLEDGPREDRSGRRRVCTYSSTANLAPMLGTFVNAFPDRRPAKEDRVYRRDDGGLTAAARYFPAPGTHSTSTAGQGHPVAVRRLERAGLPHTSSRAESSPASAIFALGIMPYITASIILQLLTVVVPSLEKLRKEGEVGQQKITQYTRYLTVGLAFAQSIGYVFLFRPSRSDANTKVVDTSPRARAADRRSRSPRDVCS
jgi:hypothetical protein